MLETVHTTVKATVNRLKNRFNILEVDTSKEDVRQTVKHVIGFALQLIEQQLEERILRIDTDRLQGAAAR